MYFFYKYREEIILITGSADFSLINESIKIPDFQIRLSVAHHEFHEANLRPVDLPRNKKNIKIKLGV